MNKEGDFTMKKRLIGITLTAVMAFSLAACGGSSSSSSASGSGSASASNSTASGDSIVLTLNHDGATDHPYNYGCEKFADLVKEKTNGEVTVEVYPSSQIASGAKAVEFVQMQTLDMDLAATTSLINFAPIIGTLDMPFLFDNKDEVFKILDGDIGKEFEDAAEESGIKILSWFDNGFKNVSNSVRPITCVDDYKGLKIRTSESDVYLKLYEALGASPTAMAVGEVYTAIQTGVVDGQDNTTANFVKNKYAEVQKYFTVTNHIYTAEPLIINLDKFNSLTEDQQKAVEEAAQEAAEYERELSIEAEESDLQAIKDAGVEVTVIEDKAPFIDKAQVVYDAYKDQYGEMIDKIKAELGK